MNNLAYVKGVMDGDGDIDRGNQYRLKHGVCKPRLRLQVTSKGFADSFSESLARLNLIPRRYETDRTRTFTGYTWTNHVYIVRATCPESLIEQLSSLNVQNKELGIDYIKGFFESEGSLYKRKYSPHREDWRWRVHNKDLKKLALVQTILSELGIRSALRNYLGHVALLEISKKSDIVRLEKLGVVKQK